MSRQSSKQSHLLLEISYESLPEPIRISDAESALVTPRGVFQPFPSIEIDKLRYGPGPTNPKYRVRVQEDLFGFATNLTEGRAFHRVYMTAYEYTKDASGSTTMTLFNGEVSIGRRNVGGRSGVFEFELITTKDAVEATSGIPIFEECDNVFGDEFTCGFDFSSKIQTRTALAISGNLVTLSANLPLVQVQWIQGSASAFGIRIRILDWNGADQLLLAERPPVDWIGASLELAPGCDGALTTCFSIYNNVRQFNGLGIGTPDYHPIFENPR